MAEVLGSTVEMLERTADRGGRRIGADGGQGQVTKMLERVAMVMMGNGGQGQAADRSGRLTGADGGGAVGRQRRWADGGGRTTDRNGRRWS